MSICIAHYAKTPLMRWSSTWSPPVPILGQHVLVHDCSLRLTMLDDRIDGILHILMRSETGWHLDRRRTLALMMSSRNDFHIMFLKNIWSHVWMQPLLHCLRRLTTFHAVKETGLRRIDVTQAYVGRDGNVDPSCISPQIVDMFLCEWLFVAWSHGLPLLCRWLSR